MSFFHFSQNRALRIALCFATLLIVFPTLFQVIFAAKDEISYSAGAGVSTCSDFYISDDSESSRCTSTFDITIGNTGVNDQSLVVVELSSVPKNRRLHWNVLDIVATNRTPAGPSISSQQLGDDLQITIQNLQANRLVEMTLSSQGMEFALVMESIDVDVRAEGALIETNPRMTVALRFIRNITGIFGF